MITVFIEEQLKMLNELEAKVKASLKKTPEGILNVIHSGGRNQYYLKLSASERHGKYLPKKEIHLAAGLAQRDYDREFLAAVDNVRKRLGRIRELGAERNISRLFDELAAVYEHTYEARRVLIRPYVKPLDLFVKEWEGYSYAGLSFSEDAPEIFTERGERVRSKSEKMIADKLLLMKIPYRYECPLDIGRNGPVYPDFTILDVRDRREVVYEHFGMMQDSKYACDALNKIVDYQRAGYSVGENFLFTMESTSCPLNMRMFEKMIRERFCD